MAYELSLFYRSAPELPAPVLRSVVYRLTREYVWEQWSVGPALGALAPGSWVRHAIITEQVPAGTIALSFGIRLESAGTVHVDDFEVAPAFTASSAAE